MNAKQPPGRRPGADPAGASLLDRILAPANLAQAWEEVAANQGIPGADRVSIARFARNWEEHTARLAADVRAGRYRPGRLRVLFIPKARGEPAPAATAGGGAPGPALRRITVPTVADRVLQRATLQVLQPRLDRAFLSCSYGYRPKRGVAQATAAVIRYRDRGLRYVVEADIDDCFGSLDHGILLDLLRRQVADERVMALMAAWLQSGGGRASPAGSARPQGARPHPAGGAGQPAPAAASQDERRGVGIALGMPISPLWANLYLHELDWPLVRNRWPLVRYADDFVVLVATPEAGEAALELIERVLAGLRLRLEPTKTRISSFEEGFTFLGVHFQGDEYTFTWQQKRITVEGPFRWLWGEYMTYDY